MANPFKEALRKPGTEPAAPGGAKARAEEQARREAAALRANLRRRKAQASAREKLAPEKGSKQCP